MPSSAPARPRRSAARSPPPSPRPRRAVAAARQHRRRRLRHARRGRRHGPGSGCTCRPDWAPRWAACGSAQASISTLVRATEAGIAGPALRCGCGSPATAAGSSAGPTRPGLRAPGRSPCGPRRSTSPLALPGWGAPGSSRRRRRHRGRAARPPRRHGVRIQHCPLGRRPVGHAHRCCPRSARCSAGSRPSSQADTDDAVAGLVDVLTALGVLDAAGGFDSTTLGRLLADPAAVVDAALADATRTASLAAGLRSMRRRHPRRRGHHGPSSGRETSPSPPTSARATLDVVRRRRAGPPPGCASTLGLAVDQSGADAHARGSAAAAT